MALYRIDVGDGTDINTVVADVGWRFSKNLNQINEAELKFSGTGEARRALLGIGSTVTIYKDGVIAFKGLIDNTDYFIGGTIVFHASGWEVWMAKEPGAYSGSPWTATASATIFSEIIAESSYISAGTINAGYSMDYRLTTSQTLWNAMSNLANKTSQDVSIDYTADPVEMSILDHTGSSTSVAVLNEGKEITNLRRSQGYPRGNSIIIKGKGDGTDQITATDSDATSIAAYGTITKTIVDRSIMTTAEATRLAAAELAMNKDPPNIYDFDLTNPDYATLNLGDIITLNALDQDVTNEEVRIVGIEEGKIGGKAFITLQVTNPALKRLMRTKNKIMAQLKKDQDDNQTYMQGSGNLSQWEGIRNANNTVGLKIPFYIGGKFLDEAGNLRIASLTVDYDIDKFNKEYGDVSEDDEDPSIDNSTFCSDDNESTQPLENDYTRAITTLYDSWTSYWEINNVVNHGEAIIFHVHGRVIEWDSPGSSNSVYVRIYHVDETDYYPSSGGLRIINGPLRNTTSSDEHTHTGTTSSDTHSHGYNAGTYDAVRVYNSSDDWGYVESTESDTHSHTFTTSSDTHTHYCYSELNGNCTIYIPIDPYLQDFDVQLYSSDSDNGLISLYMAYYVISQHEHGDGDYKTDNHNHSVSIGDGVSEAERLNATNVTLYLQRWNTGTTTWDTLVTYVPNPAKTLDYEIDMMDSGTYPDTEGWYRIRIITNNASPDLIQASVTMKHNLDN